MPDYLNNMTILQTAVMMAAGFLAITMAYRGKHLYAIITILMWALGAWIGNSLHLMD